MDFLKTWLAGEQPIIIVGDPKGCGKYLLIRHSISRLHDEFDLTFNVAVLHCNARSRRRTYSRSCASSVRSPLAQVGASTSLRKDAIGLLHEGYQSAITQQLRHFRDRDVLVPRGNAQWLLRRRPRVPMPSRKRSKPTYGHCRILAMVSRFG